MVGGVPNQRDRAPASTRATPRSPPATAAISRRFTIPERRVIRYAVIGAEQVARPAPATDAEIAAVYRNSPAPIGRPRDPHAVAVDRAADPAGGRRLRARRCAAAPPSRRRRRRRATPPPTSRSATRRRDGVRRRQPRRRSPPRPSPPRKGAIVGPVRSGLGWHVVRVDDVKTVAGAAARGGARRDRRRRSSSRRRRTRWPSSPRRIEKQLSRAAPASRRWRAPSISPSSRRRRSPRPARRSAAPAGWTAPPELAPLLHAAFEHRCRATEPAVEHDGPEPALRPARRRPGDAGRAAAARRDPRPGARRP